MNRTLLIALLRSAQSAATALALAIDPLIEELSGRPINEAASAGGPCRHPEDKRRNIGVMGDPDRFVCGGCGDIVSSKGENTL